MKKTILVTLLMLFATSAVAQSQEVYKFWVKLRDKAGTAYTLENPSAYLGPRALQRRQRQHIAVDSLDLPVSHAYLQTLRQAGFMIQNRTKWLNGVTLFATDSSLATVLDSLPFVDTAYFCEKGTVEAPSVVAQGRGLDYEPIDYQEPFDTAYYNYSYPQIAQLNGIALHRNGFEGQGIVIGVCDGGFPGVDTTVYFQTMREEGRLLATRNFVWSGNQVFSVHGHGTKVLSLMASYLPGFFVGTAPKATYVLCRTENTMSETLLEEYNWISAAEYLDSLGADIITTSLGYFHFDDSTQDHTLADLDGKTTPMSVASDIAVTRGMLVINSAGNDGAEGSGRLNSPADAARVLTVGAVDEEGNSATFSSFGPTADLRLKPDVMALGTHVYGATAEGCLSQASGTSLSAPIMAGMMACLWQRYPRLIPAQLCDSVRRWGDRATSPDIHCGFGLPDFSRPFGPDTVPELSIPHKLAAFELTLYPNPCRQQVTVRSTHPGILSLRDRLGREVRRVPLDTPHMQLTLRHLPAGLYYVTLVTPAATLTRRLLLQ